MSSAAPSVVVQQITKQYGSFQAVKGVDFEIRPPIAWTSPCSARSCTKAALQAGTYADAARAAGLRKALAIAKDNLLRAWKNGVMPATGSAAGNALVFHGPTVHRELQLWVEAGIPPAVALEAATWNAARLLGAGSRIGLVVPGYDANLLLVDGDPTRDISATERISLVVFKGERVRRAELFDPAKNPLE